MQSLGCVSSSGAGGGCRVYPARLPTPLNSSAALQYGPAHDTSRLHATSVLRTARRTAPRLDYTPNQSGTPPNMPRQHIPLLVVTSRLHDTTLQTTTIHHISLHVTTRLHTKASQHRTRLQCTTSLPSARHHNPRLHPSTRLSSTRRQFTTRRIRSWHHSASLHSAPSAVHTSGGIPALIISLLGSRARLHNTDLGSKSTHSHFRSQHRTSRLHVTACRTISRLQISALHNSATPPRRDRDLVE